MVAGGRSKAGGTIRTTMRVRTSVAEDDGVLQQTAPGFDAASTAARRRKVENSVNDESVAIAETIA
jgi:hypothetical protein